MFGTPDVKVILLPKQIEVDDAEMLTVTVNSGLTVIVNTLLDTVVGFAHTSAEGISSTVILSKFTRLALVSVAVDDKGITDPFNFHR